ncbi:MAG: DUF6132 family protein [Bacteroidales bacterium]
MTGIKAWLKRTFTFRFTAGIILGAVAGYLYYHFIGCRTGTCPLKSNPYLMTLYGMLFGGILFYKKEKE